MICSISLVPDSNPAQRMAGKELVPKVLRNPPRRMVTRSTTLLAGRNWPFGRSANCTSGIYLHARKPAKLTGMTRPPVYSHIGKAVVALLLLASLTILVGCQGLSAGNSSQQQDGILDFGNATLNFGSVAAGTSETLTLTAKNSENQAVTISSAAITTKYFTLTAPSLPVTVEAGQTSTISVKFSPDAIGPFSATVSVTSTASNTVTNLTLTGTGTANGQLAFSGASGDFGGVTVGGQQSQTVTLTNNGATSVNLQQASVTGPGFQLSGISTDDHAAQSTTLQFHSRPRRTAVQAAHWWSRRRSSPALTMGLTGTGISAGILGSSPASLSFGTVPIGTKQTLAESLVNTGSSSITISQVAIAGGSGFSMSGITAPVTLAAGQSAPFSVSFDPTAAGTVSGNITIVSNASNSTLTIPLSGAGATAGPLASNPASLNFGNVAVGVKQTLSATVTNTGGSSVTISQVAIAGGSGFSMSGITAPVTLTGGQSTTFSVSFMPTAAGAVSGSVTLTSNGSNPTFTVPLSGTGATAGPLSPNPASLNFGSVTVGVKQTLSETVTNTGGSSVTISQVAIAGGSGFSMSGITAPVTLTDGQSASFTVSFDPTATGAVSGTVTITSNGSNPTLTIPLSGTGTSVAPGALGSNPSSLSFGSVQVGVKQTLSETVTNTGSSSITISQAGISGSGFTLTGITTPVTLTGGQSTSFSVSFTPPAAGAASGSVTITSNASNPTLTIPLSGTGVAAGALGSNPTSLSFGSVQVGVKQTLSETVTNTGSTSVTISQAGISGSGFTLTGITTPVTLTGGQSTSFSVSFTPTAAGAASGSVTITSNASNPTLTVPLSGTGVAPGALGANPSSLGFGSVQVGVKQTLSEAVTNTGSTSVTISQAGISGSGFTLTGITTPVTLTAGQSTSFSVSFTPTAAGAVSGNVTITSNASNPTLTIPLSGTGVTPGTLGSNPTSLSFGSVQVGVKQTLSETVTNTGGSSVTISAAAASGSGFSLSGIATPVTLTAGQSASFSVSFTPTAAGAASGNVTITSDASNPTLTIPLSGTGTSVAAGTLGSNPTSLSFGSVQVGVKQTLSETVTNTGGSSVTISAAAASGSGFSLSGIATPLTLTAGQSTSFSVSFTPTASGAVSGNVTITSNASNPALTIPLSGTGVAPGALGSNPTSLSFGSVQVGVKQTLSETVTNTGGSSVMISAAAASGSGFTLTGITTPVTLTAGQSATFTVSFTPTAAGAVSGSVTITSNASNPTLTVPLSGTGTSVAAGALGASPTSLSFGSVEIADTQTLSETLTNPGSTSITISQIAVSGTGFSVSGISTPVTLTAGQSTSFSVSFAPPSSGAKSGNVTVTSNASNPTLTILLSGTGTTPGTLVSNPTSLSFVSVQVSATNTLSETITNAGGSSVTISQVALSGAGFSVSGISAPVTLNSGQNVTFSVLFTPTSAGAVSGDVIITSNASDPTFVVPLSGTGTAGTGQLTVAPTTLALGSVVVGDSGTGSGTLTASGASVTVTAVSSTNSAFSVSGLSLPVTIPAGQSAGFTVTYSPTAAGAASGTLTFTSNAQPSTTAETVTGTGTAAATHTVSLSWNASTSTDVSGYNVYRAVYANSCGSFSKINSSLNAGMAYTDTTVTNGTSYCYATTAVNSSNEESGYSNIVSNLLIP